jgi:CHAT domain-containing protein
VTYNELNAAVREFYDFASLEEVPPPVLVQLHEWLIAPVQAYLKTPVLGIIPYNVLHYVPFAALSDGRRYLGEQNTIYVLPNASSLPFVTKKRKSEPGTLLAMANGQPVGLPALHNADAEVQAIATLYHTQPLLGSAATRSAFVAQAAQAGIIHVAAHGQLNPAAPLLSRIVLAPDGANDGSLTVADVYGLDLQQADLVVLSACQTQVGAFSAGDDIVGLTRAFIYAGAPSVVSSLWSVDDQATGMLMTAFYTHLKQGKSKAEACRAAQADTRAKYPHPYYWAAFVLTGDPGESSAQRSIPMPLLAGLAGMAALAAALAAIRHVRRSPAQRAGGT